MASRRFFSKTTTLLVAGLLGTGCADGSPTAPVEPLPVTTTAEQVQAFVTLVSADAQNRLLPSMANRALARDVGQQLAALDAALLAGNRGNAETALNAARGLLDRAAAGDLGDAHAIHLALNAAAQLIGLPLSAMRHIAGVPF